MTLFYQMLLQVVLILLNAFFAGSEIALLSLNKTKLKKLDEEHDRAASRMLKLVEEPSGFLSTIQIGITLAGFLGSAFASENFSVYIVNWIYNDLQFHGIDLGILNTLSMVVVTLILSYFTLIFGELVPKRIAMQKSYEFAKISSIVIAGLSKMMRPVVWFLSVSVNGVLQLLHLNTESQEESVSEEEIRLMIDLGGQEGTIDHEEKEWIENVFDFDDTSVYSAMTHVLDVIAVSIDDTKETVLGMIQESGLSRYPVYGDDINDVRGILYARDYLMNEAMNEKKSIEEMMRPAYFVPESIHIDQLFSQLQTKKVHIAIVVDEYGKTSGIITMEDLLEEIVGNIYDEYDPSEEEDIVALSENTYRIQGDVSLDDICEQTGIEFELDDDYDTLSGFIVHELQCIPSDGAIFDLEVEHCSIHVEKVEDHHIISCVVTKK